MLEREVAINEHVNQHVKILTQNISIFYVHNPLPRGARMYTNHLHTSASNDDQDHVEGNPNSNRGA